MLKNRIKKKIINNKTRFGRSDFSTKQLGCIQFVKKKKKTVKNKIKNTLYYNFNDKV